MGSALTLDEVKELQAKAANFSIEIVAEVDLPGHSTASESVLDRAALVLDRAALDLDRATLDLCMPPAM